MHIVAFRLSNPSASRSATLAAAVAGMALLTASESASAVGPVFMPDRSPVSSATTEFGAIPQNDAGPIITTGATLTIDSAPGDQSPFPGDQLSPVITSSLVYPIPETFVTLYPPPPPIAATTLAAIPSNSAGTLQLDGTTTTSGLNTYSGATLTGASTSAIPT